MDDKQQNENIFQRHRGNIYLRWGLTAFLVIVACILVAMFVGKLSAVLAAAKSFIKLLAPALYGLVIAYLLDPIVERVEKFLLPLLKKYVKKADKAETLSRSIGILAALVVFILIIYALLAMVLPQLLDSINTLIGNLPLYYETLTAWVNKFMDDMALADYTTTIMNTMYTYMMDWISTSLLPQMQTIVVNLTTSVVGVAKSLLNIIVGLIISIYLLSGKRTFLAHGKKVLYSLLSERNSGRVLNVCSYANQVFGGFIGGKIVDSAIIGVLCFIVLSIMKMPYTLLISIIVGVTNIIPFFGPFIGAIPSALLLLVINPIQCLYFVIFVVILQQLDGNVIGPAILGDATGLSSFWVVVSILVFGGLFGVVGMIIGVPTFAVLYRLVTEFVNLRLEKRGLSTVTEDYMDWHYPPRANSEHWRQSSGGKLFRKRTVSAPKAPAGDAPTEEPEK